MWRCSTGKKVDRNRQAPAAARGLGDSAGKAALRLFKVSYDRFMSWPAFLTPNLFRRNDHSSFKSGARQRGVADPRIEQAELEPG